MKKILKRHFVLCSTLLLNGTLYASAASSTNVTSPRVNEALTLNHRYHYHTYNNCVNEYITILSKNAHPMGKCQRSEALSLDWTTQYYPQLSSHSIRVRYWRGSYKRNFSIETTYLRELVDDCRGRILSEKTLKKISNTSLEFSISNPNLDREINQSYLLFPMTDEEAKNEFRNTLKQCEAFAGFSLTE